MPLSGAVTEASMGANAETTTLKERPRARRTERLPDSQNRGRPDPDAVAIGNLYRKGREAIVDSVKLYLQAGRRLIQKKDSMRHGEWAPWLRTNADVLGFRHRTTASRLMKAAAANGASTHPLSEAEAILISRTLWGNPAVAAVPKAKFEETRAEKKKSPRKRSATEIADRCIETVHAILRQAISDLQRAHAPRAKFDLLFEALVEILSDLQSRVLEHDDTQPHRRTRSRFG
jgi:Protein of unknown function (DUF3102)